MFAKALKGKWGSHGVYYNWLALIPGRHGTGDMSSTINHVHYFADWNNVPQYCMHCTDGYVFIVSDVFSTLFTKNFLSVGYGRFFVVRGTFVKFAIKLLFRMSFPITQYTNLPISCLFQKYKYMLLFSCRIYLLCKRYFLFHL